jgi:hypothetical protein
MIQESNLMALLVTLVPTVQKLIQAHLLAQQVSIDRVLEQAK